MNKSFMNVLLPLVELFLLTTLAAPYKGFRDDTGPVFAYNRGAEIEKHCSALLSSASELRVDDNWGSRVRRELSFDYGDWVQEDGLWPLMPSDHSDLSSHSPSLADPLKLVSFELKDVNSVHQFENSVSLGGIMSIGISRNSTFKSYQSSPFYKRPGLSVLTIVFEGIYLESQATGEERLLCMLGTTTLPFSKSYGNSLDLTKNYWSIYDQQHLSHDDQILLVLRYPQTFNLTSRAIKGEMRSLNDRGSFKYFDDIGIYSQLGRYSTYKFSSELEATSCNSYQAEWGEGGLNTFNSTEFCKIIEHLSKETLDVVPNYSHHARHAHKSKLGPFLPEREIQAVNRSNKDVKLVLQHVICEHSGNLDKDRISAMLRAVPISVNEKIARLRTGISGMTLSVEGTWDSSTGQICMIGCLGTAAFGFKGCNTRISLFFPHVFSIKQRSLVLGVISSNLDNMVPSLLFDAVPQPSILTKNHGSYCKSYLYYNYSVINQATSFMNRNQTSKVLAILKRFFFKYPSMRNGENLFSQLSLLSSDLNVKAYAVHAQSLEYHKAKISVSLEVLSLGPLLAKNTPWSHDTTISTEKVADSQLLNISVHLIFTEASLVLTETSYRNISSLFLEGVYDQLTGEMYLIGCRRIADGNISIESGLDCLIEGKIQYASESTRWLKNPSVEIMITSRRNQSDPLYFGSLSLETYMIQYSKHREDVAFRKLFEGVLRVFIILVAIGILWSQSLYMNAKPEIVPYISLPMLAEQILGYSIELINNREILFVSKESVSYKKQNFGLNENQFLLKSLDHIAKLLCLFALLLSTILYRKVAEAWQRPNAYGSNRPSRRISQSEHVLLRNLRIHLVVSSVLVFIFKALEIYSEKSINVLETFSLIISSMKSQILVAQDFFLLCQIFENSQWKVPMEPLRKIYYIGLTMLRVLIYAYEYIRDPITDPSFDEFGPRNIDTVWTFLNLFSNPIITITLAFVVYIQQSWNSLKSFRLIKFKLFPSVF